MLALKCAGCTLAINPIDIESLGDLVLSSSEPQEIVVMLEAYFDASEQRASGDPERAVICVAGFLSPVRKWKRFQRDWQKLLDAYGLEYFHMTDFENYKRQYKSWTKPRHEQFLRQAATIIKSCASFGFASAVVDEEYTQAKKHNYRLSSMSAFTFCVVQCLHTLKSRADKTGYWGPIAYVFESGDGYDDGLNTLFNEIASDSIKKKRFRFGSWTCADKKQVSPLQAADICAYENTKEMVNNKALEQRIRPVRASADILFEGLKHDFRRQDGLINAGLPNA
jgi:hypothetical protein